METTQGGIKAVVWTVVFQFFMIFMGMSAILVQANIKSGGFSEIFTVAYNGGRLQLFE